MDAQAGANTPRWLHHPATRLEQASTDVLEKKMKRDTVSAYRSRARAAEQMVDHSVAAIKAERDAKWAASKAAIAAKNTPIPFTEDQYKAARVIRTRLGWYEVVRVSAKSVTVKTPHSWDDRILRSKILEVRS